MERSKLSKEEMKDRLAAHLGKLYKKESNSVLSFDEYMKILIENKELKNAYREIKYYKNDYCADLGILMKEYSYATQDITSITKSLIDCILSVDKNKSLIEYLYEYGNSNNMSYEEFEKETKGFGYH